jgi:guanylate kinase
VNPFPVVLSAPSGSGKTTVTRELRRRRDDVGYSVSCTTRGRREDEQDGIDYFFLSNSEFARRRDRGDFAEWAEVHGQLYGTLKAEVQRVLDSGQHVLMDIDVQGAAQLVVSYPSCVTVFVLPPSVEVLVERLRARHTENPATLLTRLRSAHAELGEVGRYHYVVVNDDLDAAVRRVSSIIDAEEVRRERVRALGTQVAGLISRLEQEIEEYAAKA